MGQPPHCPVDTRPWFRENFYMQRYPGWWGLGGCPPIWKELTPPGDHPVPTRTWMLNSGGSAVGPGQSRWTVPAADRGMGTGEQSSGITLETWGGAGPGSLASARCAVGPVFSGPPSPKPEGGVWGRRRPPPARGAEFSSVSGPVCRPHALPRAHTQQTLIKHSWIPAQVYI